MKNPIARNIPIGELVAALTDMMLRGNKYVDIIIEEDWTLRLRGLKRLSEQKKKKGKTGGQKFPPSDDIELMDLI